MSIRTVVLFAAVLGLLLVPEVCWAGPPLSVMVTLEGPDEGFADDPLEYLATGEFDLDGATQTEVGNGEATVEEEYEWVYEPGSCDTAPADSEEETFRFALEDAPGEYTIIVTYTVTVRYRNGTTDEGWDSDSIDVEVLIPPFSVEIIEPPSVELGVTQGTPVYFCAVAYSTSEGDVSEEATWLWDFGDQQTSDENPTWHTFQSAGNHQVTVTASWEGQQAGDARALQASAPEEIPPEAEDFEFFARSYGRVDDGGEICDQTELVVRTAAGHQFTARFYGRLPNGEWSQCPPLDWGAFYFNEEENGVQYQAASPNTLPTESGKNGPGTWRAEVMIEQGAEDPPIVVNLYLTLTANNTVVKDTSPEPGIILHQPNESHEITWDISHMDYEGPGPTFDVDVEIYALTGGEPLVTLHHTEVPLGAGGCEWDGKIEGFEGMEDAPKGIYTYKIIASHGGLGCDDRDKSERLGVWVSRFYYFGKDVEAGKLMGRVKYTLSRDAAAMTIQFYGPDLKLLAERGGQPCTAGVQWSEACQLSPVEFDANENPIGPIYCVLYATECAADGELNRDSKPKPALQKGTTDLQPGYSGLLQVSFDGAHYHDVAMDDGSGYYSAPHWLDQNLDGDTLDEGERQYPACYKRGTKMRTQVVIKLDPTWEVSGDVLIRGYGPGDLNIPATEAELDTENGTATFKNGPVQCPLPFPNVVRRYAPLTIVWEVSTDGGNTWHEAGVSHNEVFLYRATTLSPSPGCTTPFRTVLYLACNNGGSEPDEIAANTWAMFAGPAHVKAWRETDRDYTRPLCYWGPDFGGSRYTAAELLQVQYEEGVGEYGDGECDAWCDLLMEAWKVNRLGGFRQYEVRSPVKQAQEKPWGFFWVREVALGANPQGEEHPPFVYYVDDIEDAPGLPGQNSLPAPQCKQFDAHWIVGRGKTYYDPSYGFTATGNEDYTDKAIALFSETEAQDWWRVPRYSSADQVFVRFIRYP